MNKRETGSRYETYAAACLERRGYRIVEKNYRCRLGEIDLVARDGRYLVFVEVKYRQNGRSGGAAEAVDVRKQRKIMRVAQQYLLHRKLPFDTPCRFDVAAVDGTKLRLIQNAFGGLT